VPKSEKVLDAAINAKYRQVLVNMIRQEYQDQQLLAIALVEMSE